MTLTLRAKNLWAAHECSCELVYSGLSKLDLVGELHRTCWTLKD